MGARELKATLDNIGFDRISFLHKLIDYVIMKGKNEMDEARTVDALIDLADRKGLIRFYYDEVIALMGPEKAQEVMLKIVMGEVDEWLSETNLQQIIEDK